MNQPAFAENMTGEYENSSSSNIPGSPGVDLGPKKEDELEGNEEFPQY